MTAFSPLFWNQNDFFSVSSQHVEDSASYGICTSDGSEHMPTSAASTEEYEGLQSRLHLWTLSTSTKPQLLAGETKAGSAEASTCAVDRVKRESQADLRDSFLATLSGTEQPVASKPPESYGLSGTSIWSPTVNTGFSSCNFGRLSAEERKDLDDSGFDVTNSVISAAAAAAVVAAANVAKPIKSAAADGVLFVGNDEFSPTSVSGVDVPGWVAVTQLTRTLLLTNFFLEESDAVSFFAEYGDIDFVNAAVSPGNMLVSYYDVRSARYAMEAIQGSLCDNAELHYASPCGLEAQALYNGTLAVFNLASSVTSEDLLSLFSVYGTVKEVRENPHNRSQRFVEYHDVRCAESALAGLNRGILQGKPIRVQMSHGTSDFSRRYLPLCGGKRVDSLENSHGRGAPDVCDPPSVLPSTCNLLDSMYSTNNPLAAQEAALLAAQHVVDNTLRAGHKFGADEFAGTVVREVPAIGSTAFPAGSVSRRRFCESQNLAFFPPYTRCEPAAEVLHNFTGEAPANTFVPLQTPVSWTSQLCSNYPQATLTTSEQQLMASSQQRFGELPAGYLYEPANLLPQVDTVSPSATASVVPLCQAAAEAGVNRSLQAPFSPTHRWPSGTCAPPQSSACQVPVAYSRFTSLGVPSIDQLFISSGGGPSIGPVSVVDPSLLSLDKPRRPAVTPHASIDNQNVSPFNGISTSSTRSRNKKDAVNLHTLSLDTRSPDPFELYPQKVIAGQDPRTALMIRNIPNKYTQDMLLAIINKQHKGHYDFFYLPIDFRNKCNMGYAFINLTDPQHVLSFYASFHKKKWEHFNSEKVTGIAYARIQTRSALVAHFQNSSLLHEDKCCRPILFDENGEQEAFPRASHPGKEKRKMKRRN